MKRISVISLVIFFLTLNYSFQALAQMPPVSGSEATVLGWVDDNHFLLRRYEAGKTIETWKVNIRTGREEIFPDTKSDEQLLTESLPDGITAETTDVISPDKKSMVLVREDGLFFFKAGDVTLKRLTDNNNVVNVRFSPDGTKIAYTRNKDLYVFDISADKEIRLTDDASDRIYNGYASWVYMEEILGRASNYAAFWWSPDGKRIAFLRTDESDVPVFTLNRLDMADGIHGKLEQVPYPKAGDPAPRVRMGIADLDSGIIVWVKTDTTADQYIAWPFWSPDSRKMAIQVLNRDQDDLSIILADPVTGDYKEIAREISPTWVEFHEDVYVMEDGTGFILRSSVCPASQSGWENLFYYSWEGDLLSQITDVEFRVTSVERVDEKQKQVYFYATGPESTDLHLFRAGLDGKDLLQISTEPGTHNVNISPSGSYFLDTWSSIMDRGSIIAIDRKGKMLKEIHSFKNRAGNNPGQKSELITIRTSDGLFDMPVIITYPLNFNPSKKYPVIFDIYGGPDRKNVENRWQDNINSWYSLNGIITVKADHRGSGHFGKRGLDYLHRSLGKWEILDYSDVVTWLRDKSFVDTTSIGIRGSSYGGYLTCLALTRGAAYWTHGFAGSSVTDWRLYDNVYTERYMDKPQDNPVGYDNGSVIEYAGNLKGKLYLNHGDMDDNVHMQNSIWLISRLQDEGKTFRFMLYPDERHGWRGAKRLHSTGEEYEFWLNSFFGDSYE